MDDTYSTVHDLVFGVGRRYFIGVLYGERSCEMTERDRLLSKFCALMVTGDTLSLG